MAQLRILAVVSALLWSTAAFAHHPFSAEFDSTKPVTLEGTVTQVEWRSPHVYAYVDVKDPSGKVVNWKVEMGGPEALTKAGWTRTSVKPGDQVTIQGWQARATANLANAESFTLPAGKKMAAASSFDVKEPEGQLARSGQASEALPSTASPLMVYGLAGLLALAGALGIRAVRK